MHQRLPFPAAIFGATWLALVLVQFGCRGSAPAPELKGCYRVDHPKGSEVRCGALIAFHGTEHLGVKGGPSPDEQRIANAVVTNMGATPQPGSVSLELAGRSFNAARSTGTTSSGPFVEYRFEADGFKMGCGTIDDAETPPRRCRGVLESFLSRGGASSFPLDRDEGTRAAPAPLGRPLDLPKGCEVLNLLGGDGNLACDDKSTLLWMKVDSVLSGDPIEASARVLRDAVPPTLEWKVRTPSCKLVGVDATCREFQLVGGAVPLRARMASAKVNGSTRFVQCMILNPGDKAEGLCAQLVRLE